ncbi:MAG: DUF4845 domain-containing protein [Gammaproteobacteria bacterium]
MVSRDKQQGMTAIGWIIVLGLIAFFVTIVLRLAPVYMESSKIFSVLDSVVQEPGIAKENKKQIQTLIRKRFQINDVKTVSAGDVTISKDKSGLSLELEYERREKFIGNVDIIANFNKKMSSGK